MRPSKLLLTSLLTLAVHVAFSQTMFKYFSAEDFAKRRARVMERIGDGIAILRGADLPEAFIKFRQDNNFYYLSGVEVPACVMMIDGKTKRTTLFVPDNIPGDIKQEALIKPGKEAEQQYKFERVASKSTLARTLQWTALENRQFYLLTSPEETAEMSRDRSIGCQADKMNDPLDGRLSKEANFYKRFQENFSSASIRNLTPFIDSMRWVKDEKEVAVLRECGKIGAHGFDEAMRVTRPGIFEYQVVAACDFVYENEGAFGPAYFPIAASGERGLSWHYNANNHLLKEGEVILLDYAPELNYYTTDITRTWPVKGKFDDTQLKFYNCIKEAEEVVIASMKPGVTIKMLENIAEGVYKKHGLEKYWFGYIGHYVGMAVHDVGPRDGVFVPGVVFNVEPIIEDKDMKVHLRLEDTIVITASGAENVTAATTVEPDKVYKLIKEKGVGEK